MVVFLGSFGIGFCLFSNWVPQNSKCKFIEDLMFCVNEPMNFGFSFLENPFEICGFLCFQVSWSDYDCLFD